MKKTPPKGQISLKDLGKGAIVSAIGAAITSLYSLVEPMISGTPINFDEHTIKTIGGVALVSGISYLYKNWRTNSEGKFMGKETANESDTDTP